MVYVLNKYSEPLMPTERHYKIRKLLNAKQAVVINLNPFVVKLLYDTGNQKQSVTLGVDAGSKTIGLSASTERKELFAAECHLRQNVKELIAVRKSMRKTRRGVKTRYRKPRFLNRRKPEGWLAPSVNQKINTHLRMIAKILAILPVSSIIVEVAQFDIQKIKNPEISGVEYQQGEQLNFWNIREYVLFRDGHTCQHCKGKSKDKVLNIHHIESRKTGSNRPDNLITLCKTCHGLFHKGVITLKITKSSDFRDAAFMNIIRGCFYSQLTSSYPDLKVSLTYGYLTKNTRIGLGLEKTHCSDAYCIANNLQAVRTDYVYDYKAFRRHKRQLHMMCFSKNHRRQSKTLLKHINGFTLYSKVKLPNNQTGFISGLRKTGHFTVKNRENKIVAEISAKKLKLLSHFNGFRVA